MRLTGLLLTSLFVCLVSLLGYENDIAKEIECQELMEKLEKNEAKKDGDKMSKMLMTGAGLVSGRLMLFGETKGDMTEEEEKLLKLKLRDCGIRVDQ